MGLKKWIAAVASSGAIGMAALGGGVIGLVIIGVTGYNILMEPDKLPDEEEEDIAKVHRLGYGECECNCVYIGEAGNNGGSGGGSSGVNNSATGSGPVTFTGTEDKSNFANSAFYFTKLACDELGVPIWIPYAKNSGEDGGSIFNNSVRWNPSQFTGLDSNVSTDNIARKSLDDGAAGFFQVEGVSVQDEMKFIHEAVNSNNSSKYDNIISKSGLDVSKYPGMQSRLTKEHSIHWTNWYDDCTYYPAALINMLEAFKVRKQISIDKHWLDQYDWFQSATEEEKDLLHTYTALTLWNNGIYAIDQGQNCYNSNPLYAKFLYAFLDTVRNRYDEFINTKFSGTYGNSGNNGEIAAHTAPARWIINNTTVLTDAEKAQFDAEFRKNGGGQYKVVLLRRFCSYGTVLIYNGMSKLSDQSALNGLAANGITITGGWSLMSSGNTTNLGQTTNNSSTGGNVKTNNPSGNNSTSSSGGSTRTPSRVANTSTNVSNRNNGGTGNLGSSGGSFQLGKLIEDATVSPSGLPIYDNYTFDPNKYAYWDTNYEQFWDGSTPQDNPLYGLGDFVNYLQYQAVTSEGPIRLPKDQVTKVANASIYDGRIAFAIPTLVHQKPSENRDKFLALAKDPANYTGKDGKVNLPTLPERGLTVSAAGLYFDIVLDNGTVIPGIAGDAKGLHHGAAKDGNYPGYWFGGVDCDGYAHLIFHTSASGGKGALWSQSILENCGGGGNPAVKEMLKGHRIASIRSYDIHSDASVNYQKYFTQGGSDSSFGLTGGSSTGGAIPGGTGNAAVGGTGGGTTTTNTGLNPNDPNWKCSCDIPCSKCMCHDNGVGGKPVGSDGNTVGSVTGGSFELKETPGVLQGLYCDLQGNQLTSEQVMEMLRATAPTIAEKYSIGIGIAPPVAITTHDSWRDKFGDSVGAMNYLQSFSSGAVYGHLNHIYHGRGLDGFHPSYTGKTFGSSSCGFHSMAIIASTMLHRYITAPECIIASYLDTQLNPNTSETNKLIYTDAGGNMGSMFRYGSASSIMRSFRYKGEYLFNVEHGSVLNNGTKAKVDAVLDAGGMISFSTHAVWTNFGHFIVIREKAVDENGAEYYLTVDSSHSENSSGAAGCAVRHQYSDFITSAVNPSQVTYITPGPGYEKYINDMKSGSGSTGSLVGSGSTIQNQSVPSTEEILKMSQSDIYKLLTGDKYSSYAEVNTAWAGGANKAQMRALFDSKVVSVEVPVWVWDNKAAGTKRSSTTNIKVSKQLENYFRDFMTDLYNCPEQYVIFQVGGYEVRSKNTASGKSSSISGHSFGGTLDINWESPHMSLGAAYVRNQSSLHDPELSETCTRDSSWFEVVKKYHLNWGGMWSKSYIDPMHFSIVGDGGEFPNYDYNNFKSD